MQRTLRKSSSNIGTIASGGICTPKKSLRQNNHKSYRRDRGVPSIMLRNSDKRSVISTFFEVELGACWVVIVPLQGSHHLGCGADAKMNEIDKQNSRTNHHLPDHKCCAKSIASNSLHESNDLVQSQNGESVNKITKTSQQGCDSSSDCTGSRYDGSFSTSSADFVEEVDKPIKKSLRKRLKKKRRQPKKAPRTSDTAVLREQGVHDISAPDTCSNSDLALGGGCCLDNNLSDSATPIIVLLEVDTKGNFYNEGCSSDSVNLSATISKATSCGNDVELLETTVSLPLNSACDDFCSNLASVGEISQIVTTNTMQPMETTRSALNCKVLDAHLEQKGTSQGSTSGFLSGEHSASVSDLLSDGWSRDGSIVYSKPPIGKEDEAHHFDVGLVSDCCNCGTSHHGVTSGKGHSTCGTSKFSNTETANGDTDRCKFIANTDNNSDGARCGSEDSGGCSDGFTVISRKKGRKSRKSLVNSNMTHRVNDNVDLHGWSGKESNLSLLHKVQKTTADKRIFLPKDKDTVCLQFDASNGASLVSRHELLVGTRVHENPTRSACAGEISAQEDGLRRSARTNMTVSSPKLEYYSSNINLSEKLKGENSSKSKGQCIHNSGNSSHIGKASLDCPTKMNLPQKEACDIPLAGNNCNRFSSGSISSCSLTNSFNHCSSEPLCYSEAHPEKTIPGNVTTLGSDANSRDSRSQAHILSAASDSTEQLEVESVCSSKFSMGKPGDSCIRSCNENGHAELEAYVSQVENSKPDHNSRFILPKRIAFGRKDEICHEFSHSNLEDQSSHRWNLNRSEEEQVSFVPFHTGLTYLGFSSGSVNYTPSGGEVTSECRLHAPHMTKGCVHIPPSYQPVHKSSELDVSVDETESSKILRAVNDAYRMQIESEGLQMAIGSPLAEFEKLLYSASPVLDQTCKIQHCDACLGDQLVSDFLCRHQMPNVTLGSLWLWYEMIGSFGLEVKVDDCNNSNSKRFSGDHSQFCAYFVPSLSAVQLFGESSSSIRASNVMSNAEFTRMYDLDATSEYSSCSSSQRVFSAQLPLSHREEETENSLPRNLLSTSCSFSACNQDEACKELASSACIGYPELLFEYFESERPWQRRPLFEKIQELAKGNATSNSQIFGDPRKLMCLRLQDLHPSSWYSVAWYPIYRIPDGNFRAVFLTYHSLGHFVHRSTSSDSSGGNAIIVSPVVGLQSFNAQGECWFQPKNSTTQMEGSLWSYCSEVLKERLKTLEQTAHVMARASFFKGDKKSVNKQPDYEFFLSRRR